MKTNLVILLYLVAIVTANNAVAAFGVGANYAMSFLFIAFNLVSRDYLHERWTGDFRRMAVLILSGSLLTYAVNVDAAGIALASFCAFASAGLVDYLVYQRNMARPRLVKSNLSNLSSALVDSAVFTVLAFGWGGAAVIILIDWGVKVAGGAFWSVVFFGRWRGKLPLFGA